MTNHIEIFIQTAEPIRKIAGLIGLALSSKVEEYDENDENWYAFELANITLTFGEHDFESEENIDFASYQYDLTIGIPFGGEFENDNKRQEQFQLEIASRLFDKFVEENKFDLLMTRALSKIIREYHP